MGFLDTLFGGGAEKEAAAKNTGLINQYYGQGNQILSAGLPQATQPYQTAIGDLSGLQSKYGAGTSTYLDALGVNGPAAQQRAYANFQTGPGYQAGITQGLDAINRAHALSGNLNSGNTDLDAMTYAQNAQNQQYNNWLSNLSGLVSPEMAAASGQAGLAGGLSNVYQGNTANQIGLLTGQTQGLVGQNNLVAQGEEQGAGNLLGLAKGVMGLGASFLGGPGGGMLGKKLFG